MTARRAPIATLATAAAIVVAAAVAQVVAGGNETIEVVEPANPADVYDPVAAGEPLPAGFRVGLARDAIEPVYHPEFTSAGGVDWPADMLVIGIAGGADAKAYPVTHLNSHEMVIDSLAGIPILVTW